MSNGTHLSKLTPQERAEGVLADSALFVVDRAFAKGECQMSVDACWIFSPSGHCEECRLHKLMEAHEEYARVNEL